MRGGTGLPDIKVMKLFFKYCTKLPAHCAVMLKMFCLLSAPLAMFTLLIKHFPQFWFSAQIFLEGRHMIFQIWFISNIGQQFYRCSHATLLRSNCKVNLAHCCVCEYLLFLPVPSCHYLQCSFSVIYNVCVLRNLIWRFHSCTVKKTRITFTSLTLCVFLHFRWGGDFF